MQFFSKIFLFLLASLLLNGCQQNHAPDEVTLKFWEAVVENDKSTLQSLAATGTLTDISLLDNSEHKLKHVDIGTITIQDNTAYVATTLTGNNNGNETTLPITTMLVKQDDAWKVNAQETINSLVSTSMGVMVNEMSQSFSNIGKDLSQAISGGLQEFMREMNKGMPALQEGMEQLSDEESAKAIGQQLGQIFSQGLKDVVNEFQQSMDELSRELEAPSPATPPEPSPQAEPIKPHEQQI